MLMLRQLISATLPLLILVGITGGVMFLNILPYIG
jgi:hypothetical protein